jgi:hypothetical protein
MALSPPFRPHADLAAIPIRRIVHPNITDSPTAAWTSPQMIQAFRFERAPRYPDEVQMESLPAEDK